MELEDHIGDIIRKGRQAANVSKEDVARVGGLGLQELEQLEDSGDCPKKPNYEAIAALIGLNGGKLRRIAEGWTPGEIHIGEWREVRQITTAQRLSVNCYLVWDEVTRDAAVFDTGWQAEPIVQMVEKNGLSLKHLFITHTHEDHIAAMGEFIRFYLSRYERWA